MAPLGSTVAELVRRSRAPSAGGRALLEEADAFGANPGALRMLVYRPPGLAANAPLVVVLHGCAQTAEGYAHGSGWITLANRYGFAVVCPEQSRSNNPNMCFNWFTSQDVGRGLGEAASIAAMTQHAIGHFRSDPGRVFITGLSAGGAMTAALLATYPELFRGGAVIAGLPYGAAEGVSEALTAMRNIPRQSDKAWGDRVRGRGLLPSRWPTIAIWHGDSDTTVAPGASDALVRQWTNVHGVSASEDVDTGSARHRHKIWRDAKGVPVVESHRIASLGHGVPIAANGGEGCGSAGPWILEAGIPSSLEIARSWGITQHRRDTSERKHVKTPLNSQPALRAASRGGVDVADVISKALKTAGLLR